jgi:hypothetical protein
MYDLIGDIHGHADELLALLTQLGYERRHGVYRHPERQVVFLGDLIDRGPRIRETLEIVRPMVEAGAAHAVLGNHELNALAFHTADSDNPREFLRPHTPKNVQQHSETLRQLSDGDLASHLDWFRSLPMWLDLGTIRAVHACWDEARMAEIAAERQGPLDAAFLHRACKPTGDLFAAVETVLKGKEAKLPHPLFFLDKDGHKRTFIRLRWFLDPAGHTYGSYALASPPVDCEQPLPDDIHEAAVPYPRTAPPVFVGHYWLVGDAPHLLAENVACLDWSVAKQGFLCGYRWSGEAVLHGSGFRTTRSAKHLKAVVS